MKKLPDMDYIFRLYDILKETYERENNELRKKWIDNELRKISQMFGVKMASWVGL